MNQILVIIHHAPEAPRTVGAIAPALVSYIATLGGACSIDGERSFLHSRNGKETGCATIVDISVDERFVFDASTMGQKVERFLKFTAKNANLAVNFDVFLNAPD